MIFSIVHFVNQFFAGIGGEDKADTPVGVLEKPSAVTRALQSQLAEQARVTTTIYCGDNYFHEHPEEAKEAVLREVRERKPQLIVAGPAFNSGRYGLAGVEICHAVASDLGIPCVTAMHPDNPAVEAYRKYRNQKIYLLPTAETVAGMNEAMKSLARFTRRLASGVEIGSAEKEGYLPRGIRRQLRTDRPAVERAIEMLMKKLRDEPFVTELPMETWDQITPAPPLRDLSNATIALVTTSGVVPWGNPDGFRTFRNTFWRKYGFAELGAMEPGRWEAVHGGYNVSAMNEKPHYGVPLDALRALEAERFFGRLYPAYYVVPGNQGNPTIMRRIGQEIAADLRKEGANGVLLVAT
jgi:glycine reductase